MIPWLRGPHDALPDTRRALGPDSEAPGLLAAGGELTPQRLAEAYAKGVFPWYSRGQPVLWWSPDPRMVLPVGEFVVSRSLRKTIHRFVATPGCEVRIDSALGAVIRACATVPREGQDGTWIVPEMIAAYSAWPAVHSFETWIDGRLAGGLYGVCLGRMFYGESMFARATDASKVALAALVAMLRDADFRVIDCQQNTRHLASLGAREIGRSEFLHLVSTLTALPPPDWRRLSIEIPHA